jgi:hypothetical protein
MPWWGWLLVYIACFGLGAVTMYVALMYYLSKGMWQ